MYSIYRQCLAVGGMLSCAHGGRWRARTYGVPALFSLWATCVVFWSHRRRDIVYTAVMFSPERMYIILDSSTCTSYPSLKRHKYICRFCKATGLHELSSFLLWYYFSFLITDSKVLLQKSLKWSFIYLCLESHPCLCYFERSVHWCQVWIISAKQLFSSVPRRLVLSP